MWRRVLATKVHGENRRSQAGVRLAKLQWRVNGDTHILAVDSDIPCIDRNFNMDRKSFCPRVLTSKVHMRTGKGPMVCINSRCTEDQREVRGLTFAPDFWIPCRERKFPPNGKSFYPRVVVFKVHRETPNNPMCCRNGRGTED